MKSIYTLEDYEPIGTDEAQAFALPEARSRVEAQLAEHGSLYRAASRARDVVVLQGREPVYAPATPQGRWVVRRYHRGGLVAHVLGDRHLRGGTPRPVQEARASREARNRDVRTPRVLAGAVYPRGLFYRADLVTEFVPESRDLARVLFGGERKGLSGSVDRREALKAAGELVRKMARVGVHHPDMNAKNVLLEWSGAAPIPWLVDLDRVSVQDAGGRELARTMHRRLVRSLEKWEKKSGLQLSEAYFGILEDAVEAGW